MSISYIQRNSLETKDNFFFVLTSVDELIKRSSPRYLKKQGKSKKILNDVIFLFKISNWSNEYQLYLICGLYYKHIMIVIDAAGVVSK